MNNSVIERVISIVGSSNVRTDIRERSVYANDIGVMPPLIKPFIPTGLPGIVIRPQNESQIIELLAVFNTASIPLVVRAGASSGYGGVLPQKDAAVLDLAGWQDLIEIDNINQQARCQAGAIWEELDRSLQKAGFELRLYPSSYPSSTVGGWLAQGGSGFGSFEYGTFKENVVSARLILPTGEIREMAGAELLELVADAEGITGIISEVTFKIRPLEKTELRLVSLANSTDLNAILTDISEAELPIWSITFLNPTSAELKKQLPLRSCHTYELEEVAAEAQVEKDLPVSWLLMLALPQSRLAEIDEPLQNIVEQHGGSFLSEEMAAAEWKGRTAPMRLKRTGPSIIPTEVIVPLERLAAVLAEIDSKIDQPFVLEGMLGRGGNVVLLGYIPHDERSFKFNLAFALSLSVIKIANAQGGSGYATGLYFRREASRILGTRRIERLRSFQQEYDPNHIMNPGKVLAGPAGGGKALDGLMGLAMRMEAVIRPFANAAKVKQQRLLPQRYGIPGDVALMALTCARCGYCVHTCEQYSARGWESQSPRGKYAWLNKIYKGQAEWDRAATDTMLLCTTCERCDFRCQLQLPVEQNGMALRNKVVVGERKGTFPPFEMMAASLNGEGDIWAGRREHRDNWLPADVKARLSDNAEILFFAGCTASYVETDIAESTLRLLLDSGLEVTYLGNEESCCGIPMKMAGKWDLFSKMYRENVAAARARGVKTIVTSCPACSLVWKEFYAEEAARLGEPYEFEVKHYSELIAPALVDGNLELRDEVFAGHKVTFHDSCHLGRAQGIYEPPREMLRAIPGIDLVEMEHSFEESLCCGSVVTLVGELAMAPKLGCARLEEALAAGADTIIAVCPCCQVQLRDSAQKAGIDIIVDDLARVVATSAGYDIPPSDEYTSYMWSYFERFIVLMQPEEMAHFMVALFPQMINAMPLKMGGMVKGLGKTRAGAAMMKQMMPIMFPLMVDGILGKVMPDMLAEMEKRFGVMPEDMQAMMPELLPQVMSEMMPYYLPQLIPFLIPLFIDYLRHGQSQTETVA